ncbi:Cu(I)-responsive transcriptional regulator [Pigmentibacter sp. JX0631]|uniref:Cu(I)-responsive transcriptional regulator n=1 Tax=Pigmentibacter sp. JX0631 TaxID=2976982 RepID=UPI002468D1FA|nr:Cu(I)-responsive transcriptional regulator [Pigmentibacter sp. JX0631]WGL60975.1 Cu(I)-responsive transcriptional regulator [Pigmentibacter sp. JX0631]
MSFFNIGEAAKKSGIHIKMIRYYEEQGLITKLKRSEAGYRLYQENDIQVLLFIKTARELGFSIIEIKKLLDLWKNKKRSSQDVKKIAQQHIEKLQSKMDELKSMLNTLENLVNCCQGNDRPECPILEKLSRIYNI